jgi:hypothetical protein
MKTYTFNELSDLLDGVNCPEDIINIKDYLFENAAQYNKRDWTILWNSLEVLKSIYN